MRRLYIFLLILATGVSVAPAQERIPAEIITDSVGEAVADSIAEHHGIRGLYDKVVNYFNDTNKPKPKKKFDISFIGGPHYSSDTKFGIGMVAAANYRHSMADTLDAEIPPSELSLVFDGTTSMYFSLGVVGTHVFPHDRARINYKVSFSSVATKFWGIGYDENIVDSNECKYKYLASRAEADFVFRIARDLYLGPQVSFDYINGRHLDKPWLWHDQSHRTFNLGIGFTLQYDTRDNLTAPTRGVYLALTQAFHPRWLMNKYAFTLTNLTFNFYHGLWKDAIMAFHAGARITYGNTPWGLMSTLGGSNNMRGYFEGRYRDKSEMDVCLELRQHIWRRNSLVAWIGAGTVFPRFQDITPGHILPNWGFGYRWEFKKFVNVRLDLGFGRHQTGFIFSINEAF